MFDIFVGYDPREASAYHTFCDSVMRRTTSPVRFTPLTPDICGIDKRDGSNTFSYSRFIVPHLMGYKGNALYADGDMICLSDITQIAQAADEKFAVSCVRHDYKTKAGRKYLGSKNENYPRKNWSSVMLFNCDHYLCRNLTPESVNNATGAYLHQFKWCDDSCLGELLPEWNHLVDEYSENPEAKILHYTLGTPCFPDYYRSPSAKEWRNEFAQACRPVAQLFTDGRRND